MDGHNQIPIRIRHVLEGYVSQNTGIVEEDIDAAVVLDGGLNDSVAILDTVVVGYCFAACGFDLVDDDICGLGMLDSKGTQRNSRMRTLVEFPSPLKDPPRSLTTTLAPLEPKKRAYALLTISS